MKIKRKENNADIKLEQYQYKTMCWSCSITNGLVNQQRNKYYKKMKRRKEEKKKRRKKENRNKMKRRKEENLERM